MRRHIRALSDGQARRELVASGRKYHRARREWELSGKRLELLKEAIPKLSRVAVLWNPANQGALAEWRATQAAASVLRVTLQSLEVRNPSDVPKALSAMTQKQPDALITFLSALTTAYRPIIVEFAAKQRLPTIFPLKADVEAGGLISYSENLPDLFRRAAHYVDISKHVGRVNRESNVIDAVAA
jgi:ABC-type uncharacterized transport system substrate-binding protein